MVKDIIIGDKTVKMKATAGTPRLYRIYFKRDIFVDLQNLQADVDENNPEQSNISIESLEIFENVAYIMAKQGAELAPDFPKIEEWLDSFDMFSIYEVLPQILELWGDNIATSSNSKKKIGK